ncbi:MAG: threonylcarbamoyl-AMP synthase [Muribaculum sp.]|nr:threonylcarbamoyl-AMP synthase [Muribaculum sp.]
MTILPMYPTSLNEKYLEHAVDTLRSGGIIIYPTDTLYAIGCDALNNNAIERICRIKGINPQKTELSIICHDISQAAEYARIDNRAFKMLKEYLPGPFTFLLPSSTRLPKVFKGRKTVGIRIPDNPIPTAIAGMLGNPILTTSVEDDGEGSLIYPQSLAIQYDGSADLIIDGGEGNEIPSTIVDITDSSAPVIVRQGAGYIDLP